MPSPSRAMVLLIVLSGLIISICMGMRQSLGLFMRPDERRGRASRRRASASPSRCRTSCSGLAQPFVGALADRHGARPVLIGTALLYAAGPRADGLSARLPRRPRDRAASSSASAPPARGFGVLIGTITRATAPERRSQTVGIVAAAGSIGTLVLAPTRPGAHRRLRLAGRARRLRRASAASMALLALPVREAGRACRHRKTPRTWRSVARGHGAPRLPLHDARLLRLRLPARLHHHAPAGVPAALRRGAGRGRDRARADRAVQHDRHLHVRPARRALQPEAPARADLPAAHAVHHRLPRSRRSARPRRWCSPRPWASCGSVSRRSSPASSPACSASRTSTRSTASCSSATRSARSSARGWAAWCSTGAAATTAAWAALIVIGLTAFTLQWLMDERPPGEPKYETSGLVPASAPQGR